MRWKLLIAGLGITAAAAASLVVSGLVPLPRSFAIHADKAPSPLVAPAPSAPAVTVVKAEMAEMVETVVVTGSLVARDEILVAPEIEGLRVLELKVDEGQTVAKGDVLAVLVQDTLDAQLAQNDAALARAGAAIAQARSQIVQAEARLAEAKAAFNRAKPLRQSGVMAEAAFDQRQSAARTTEAQLLAAQDGLKVAEAEKAQVEAQRRELDWRRERTQVRAPVDGVVSRRSARVGAIASAAGEPLFRIIARGEIELDAEVPETRIGRVAAGQTARLEVAGSGAVEGSVRLVSPEIDKATRLGKVRVLLGSGPGLRIGSFARGTIETARALTLSVPVAAVLYGSDRVSVQIVREGVVHTVAITTGLSANGRVEVKSGLSEGDLVVAKAGTFLRDGDAVRVVMRDDRLSGIETR